MPNAFGSGVFSANEWSTPINAAFAVLQVIAGINQHGIVFVPAFQFEVIDKGVPPVNDFQEQGRLIDATGYANSNVLTADAPLFALPNDGVFGLPPCRGPGEDAVNVTDELEQCSNNDH